METENRKVKSNTPGEVDVVANEENFLKIQNWSKKSKVMHLETLFSCYGTFFFDFHLHSTDVYVQKYGKIVKASLIESYGSD